MGKTIRIIKLISFIIIAVEVLLGAVFSIIYFNNFFNFYNQVKPEYIAITMAVIIAVDCLFVWVIILVLSSLRQKTDLKAATIIGSDVQEAYNFAMIGLAITNDENIVLWTNDLFKERHIEIMDKNIMSATHDVSLKTILGFHTDDWRYSFLDDYDLPEESRRKQLREEPAEKADSAGRKGQNAKTEGEEA